AFADAAAEGADDVRELLVGHDLRARGTLGVEHLAAQGEDRLEAAIAAQLGVAAGRVTLDEEELGDGGVRARAVVELAREIQAVADGRLARDLLAGGAARLARTGGDDDAGDDGLRDALVVVEPLLER